MPSQWPMATTAIDTARKKSTERFRVSGVAVATVRARAGRVDVMAATVPDAEGHRP